jgi:DNA-binding GntR family transcriptional regulator
MDKKSVYEHIKQQIVEEKLTPGYWFVERELCTTYGLSRTPIREILWKLKSDGFLEQEPNKGFIVRKLGLEQIFEVFQTREAVEGMAARLACSKGDESFRSTLREIMEKLNQLDAEADPAQGGALGRQLHGTIVEAARNGIMVGIYENLKNLCIFTSNITRKSTTIEKVSKEAHLMLINALLEQDEEKSERLMRDHLRDTCRQIVEQFYPNMLGSASNSKSQAR